MTMTATRPAGRWRPRQPGDFPTLGWEVLGWAAAVLPSPRDDSQPFRFTDEQARRVLQIYRLDPATGKRLCRRCHEEEAKGWGKGPEAAVIALAEFCAPVLFSGWDADGQPAGMPWGSPGTPAPWIQIAAVSEAQTENTWAPLLAYLTANQARAADTLRLDPGRTLVYSRDATDHKIERVTASAGTREGQPITHAVLDEPQLWTSRNGGDRLADTITRNLDKTGGWAHFTGNAPVLGQGSVAETWGAPEAGVLHFATRLPEEPRQDWSDERKLWALATIYRDAPWIDLERQLASVNSAAVPWEQSLRFKFNHRVPGATEDAWMPADLWDGASGIVTLSRAVPTYVAVRIAHDHRTAAIAVAQRQGDRVMSTSRVQVADGGGYLSASALEGDVLALRSTYPATVLGVKQFHAKGKEYVRPMPGPEVAYHSAFFEGSAQRLRAAGVVLVDVPSSPERTTPAAEMLMRLVTDGSLTHDGDPATAAHMGAVVARQAPRGWVIDAADGPEGTHPPIVAAQAVMLAVHRAMTAPAPPSRALHLPRPR